MAIAAEVLGDDATLVQAVQAGDTAAFAELYRRHFDDVHRACTARLGNLDDAEEAAQAAFVKALERIDQCGGQRRFGGWVQTIAFRLCHDLHRSRSRTRPVEGPPVDDGVPGGPGPAHLAGPEEQVLAGERRRHLAAVLDTLPNRQRSVLRARDVDGRAPAAIAVAMGVSVGAVDSILLRARRAAAQTYTSLAGEHGVAGAGTAAAGATAASAGATLGSGGVLGALGRVLTEATNAVRGIVIRGSEAAGALTLPSARPPLAAGAVALVLVALPSGGGGADATPTPVAPEPVVAEVVELPEVVPPAAPAAPEAELPRLAEPTVPAPPEAQVPATPEAPPAEVGDGSAERPVRDLLSDLTLRVGGVTDEVTVVGDAIDAVDAVAEELRGPTRSGFRR